MATYRLFLFYLLTMWISLASAQETTVFHNGKVITVDDQFRIAQAIAVRGNRILAVGSNSDVLKQAGANARKVDLRGRALIPGTIDSHAHPLGAGISELREPLPRIHSIADMQDYIRKQAAKLGPGKWIIVPRTFPTRLKEQRMPTKADLDAAAPNNPVAFDASYTWVANSYALKQAGITRDTKPPANGEIGKDASGEPNGILRGAQSLLKAPSGRAEFSEHEKMEALQNIFRRYNEVGITTTTERAATEAEVRTYEAFRKHGRQNVRLHMTIRFDTNRPTEEIVKRIRALPWKAHSGDDWLKLDTLKVTMDGGMLIGTAYMREPYGPFAKTLYGHEDPKFRGLANIPPDKLTAIVRAAHELGWQFTAHAQGGGAVDALLDAYEKVNAEKPLTASRMLITHGSFSSAEATRRMKKLGVIMDAQPAWLYKDGNVLAKVMSDAAMSYFIPFKAWRDGAVVAAGGSDHMIGYDSIAAVNPYNPFLAMYTAVTRRSEASVVIRPEQRISREDALRLMTRNGAYALFAERSRGTLEAGKLADLVVLSDDPLTCAEERLRDIKAMLTMVDGRVVHEAK